MKKYLLLIILTIIATSLTIFNIINYNQKKVCTYKINEEFYQEKIKVIISHNKKIKFERDYKFENEDILKLEMEDLKDYNIKQDDLSLIATKEEKIKDYYKTIKEYEQLGFICRK